MKDSIPYNEERLLNDIIYPDKNHYPIFECQNSCLCEKTCKLKIMDLGITIKLQVYY